MFIFLLQIREALRGRPGVLVGFAAFAFVVWAIWIIKTALSRRYRPYTGRYEARVSVIVPVVDEPLDLFTDVLERIVKQAPDEVIVVINGPRNLGLERVCIDLGVGWTWTEIPGKRNAIRVGTDLATGDICVLVDSDTLWTQDTLSELLKPFADPRVGGVTTKQRIAYARHWDGDLPADDLPGPLKYKDPVRRRRPRLGWRIRRYGQLLVARFIRRWCDWMENSRVLYSMPAQSSLGYVCCLPGRTIAFRRSILAWIMPDFMSARFLGAFLEISDDRHLTNLTLRAGYRTVFQSTSLVYTDAPTRIRKLFKQQLRWARGSQYNHLRMFPWAFVHAPMLIPFFLVDLVLPYLLFGAIFGWIFHMITHSGVHFVGPILDAFPGPTGWFVVGAAIILGSTLSMWLRQLRHLVEVPRDFGWMPAYILFSSFFLMPIRLLGFFRMAHTSGWGTRKAAYAGEKHSFNIWAGIPYLAGTFLLGVEIFVVTHV